MKYRIIVLAVMILLIATSFTATLTTNSIYDRYHQHLQALPSESAPISNNQISSHLPLISINTFNQEIVLIENSFPLQSNRITAEISIFDSVDQYNVINEEPTMKTLAVIGYRGNSSIKFEKKSYKLNLILDDGSENKDFNLLGMSEHDEWVLNGPYLDRTLIRNYLCMNVAGEIMRSSPNVRFCELIVNGEYQGLYLAMESVARGVDRVNIDAYTEGDTVTPYIIRADRLTGMESHLDNFGLYAGKMSGLTAFEIIYPIEAKTNPLLKSYVEEDFSRFEKTLYSYDYDDRQWGYKYYINTMSFVDYFIINEFFKNEDAGTYSTCFYKDLKSKISIGPVWDFNNCCDNIIESESSESGFSLINKCYYNMLIKDEAFVETVIDRYFDLRNSVLSEEYLTDYIDDTVTYLGPAIYRNNARWANSFLPEQLNEDNRLEPLSRNPLSYEAAVTQLKEFIIARGNWLDENIILLRQYCHESKIKDFAY